MAYWNGTSWAQEPTPAAPAQRTPSLSRRIKPAAFVALMAVAVGAGSVFAARAGMTLSVPDGQFGGTTTATLGTTFALSASDTSSTWVRATCVVDSNGTVGMVAWERMAGGSATFALGPTPSWQSGSASCTADAGTFDRNGRFKSSASTSFHVAE